MVPGRSALGRGAASDLLALCSARAGSPGLDRTPGFWGEWTLEGAGSPVQRLRGGPGGGCGPGCRSRWEESPLGVHWEAEPRGLAAMWGLSCVGVEDEPRFG